MKQRRRSLHSGVFCRGFLGLPRTVVTADHNLLAPNLNLDSTILDIPVAHRALLAFHENSFRLKPTPTVAATFAADTYQVLTRREKSDFRILAHFEPRSSSGIATHLGGRATKFAAE